MTNNLQSSSCTWISGSLWPKLQEGKSILMEKRAQVWNSFGWQDTGNEVPHSISLMKCFSDFHCSFIDSIRQWSFGISIITDKEFDELLAVEFRTSVCNVRFVHRVAVFAISYTYGQVKSGVFSSGGRSKSINADKGLMGFRNRKCAKVWKWGFLGRRPECSCKWGLLCWRDFCEGLAGLTTEAENIAIVSFTCETERRWFHANLTEVGTVPALLMLSTLQIIVVDLTARGERITISHIRQCDNTQHLCVLPGRRPTLE